MSDFVPEGYLPIIEAFKEALEHRFGEEIASTEKRIKEESAQVKAASGVDPVRDALIASGLEEDVDRKILDARREQIEETRRQLQNALHKGELTAFYFSTTLLRDEPESIPRAFWTSPAATDVIKSGIHFPSGRPSRAISLGHFPAERVLVREAELRRFLSEEESAPDAKTDQTAIGSATALAGERYLTPHISLMLQAIEHFAISATHWPKKDELKDWFLSQKLPNGTPISPNQAEMMATFARPPEAMEGGNKRI